MYSTSLGSLMVLKLFIFYFLRYERVILKLLLSKCLLKKYKITGTLRTVSSYSVVSNKKKNEFSREKSFNLV
jgi:hypothetical protein